MESAAAIVAIADVAVARLELPEECRDLLGVIRDQAADLLTALRERAVAPPGSIRTLTSREQAVFELLSRGRSTVQIAQTLGIRPSTTRSHVQSILVKLCVRSRIEAISSRKAA